VSTMTKVSPGYRRVAILFMLGFLFTGCSWIGGEPTEAELAAEQLRQPPDVLSDGLQMQTAGSDAAVESDSAVSETVTADSTDPLSLLGLVDGEPVLDLGLPLDAAWAIVGRALDRSGFALLASDRDSRSHRIRYDSSVAGEVAVEEENGGFLSGLDFWSSEPELGLEEFEVQVAERGKGSRVSVLSASGDPAPRGAAQQVLGVLAEQLKP